MTRPVIAALAGAAGALALVAAFVAGGYFLSRDRAMTVTRTVTVTRRRARW